MNMMISFRRLHNYKMAVLFVVYAAVALVIYSRVILQAGFVFDDFVYVVGNPFIEDISSLLSNISDPRQLGYFSFSLNYLADGKNPLGYHLVNVVIHIVNGMLVFILARLLLKLCGLSEDEDSGGILLFMPALAGLLFIVHPIQTQAVSYVTQRFTSLAAFFYIASIVCYLGARRLMEGKSFNKRAGILYGLALIATAAGMKVKEISFTIPFMLVMLELLFFTGRSGFRKSLYITAPFLATLAIIPLSVFGPEWGFGSSGTGITEITRRGKIYDLTERPSLEYFATQTRVLISYLRLMVFPYNQSAVHDVTPSRSLLDLRVAASLVFHLFAVGMALLSWLRSRTSSSAAGFLLRFLALGIGWFYISAFVESSFLPIKDLMFEHRMYLPGVGIIFVFLSLLMLLIYRFDSDGRHSLKWMAAIVLFLSAVLSMISYSRNDIWLSEFNLWNDVVKKIPNKAIGYHNRGNANARLGRLDLAIEDLNRAIGFFEGYIGKKETWESSDYTPSNMAKTYMNRATLYTELGQNDKARADRETARRMVSMPLIRLDETRRRADIFFKRKAFNHAIEEYNTIINWFPEDTDALNDRGNAYTMSGRYKEAIADFDLVISREPDRPLAYHNRGIAYARSEKKAQALADFKKACEMGFEPSCESMELLRQGKK